MPRINATDVKAAVLKVALRIKSLEEGPLLDKLEDFWFEAFKAGVKEGKLQRVLFEAECRSGQRQVTQADTGGKPHG